MTARLIWKLIWLCRRSPVMLKPSAESPCLRLTLLHWSDRRSLSVQAEWGLPKDLLDLVRRIADYVDANRSKFDLGPDEEEELLRSYLMKIREQA